MSRSSNKKFLLTMALLVITGLALAGFATRTSYADGPSVRSTEATAEVELTVDDNAICDAEVATVSVDFSDVVGLYGYEFKVSYNDTALSTTGGAFDWSWFGPQPGQGALIVWDGSCASGICKFAVSLQNPAEAVDGDGTVATIPFTAAGGGSVDIQIYDVILADRDGFQIPYTLANSGKVTVAACGNATIKGTVALQGRLTPMNTGWVTYAATGLSSGQVTFSAATGEYTATVKAMPGGSTYNVAAFHYLYLANKTTVTALKPGDTVTLTQTRLMGGDANNSGIPGPAFTPGVEVTDITCISSNFGASSPFTNCGNANGSPDINNDVKVNVQDLTIAGGNYSKNPFDYSW